MTGFDMAHWGWQQWATVATYGVALLSSALVHGEPRSGKHSFPMTFVAFLLSVFVLGSAGYFS